MKNFSSARSIVFGNLFYYVLSHLFCKQRAPFVACRFRVRYNRGSPSKRTLALLPDLKVCSAKTMLTFCTDNILFLEDIDA